MWRSLPSVPLIGQTGCKWHKEGLREGCETGLHSRQLRKMLSTTARGRHTQMLQLMAQHRALSLLQANELMG